MKKIFTKTCFIKLFFFNIFYSSSPIQAYTVLGTGVSSLIGGNNNLAAVIDINKNINGLNLSFNANRPFEDSSDQNANISLSKKF